MNEILEYIYTLSIKLTSYADLPCLVRDSISNSFTVLVGFVAIGIPLSLQIISRAAERYKSDHVINYLSNWTFVTPKTIYWVSILYIILALIFSAFVPQKCEGIYLGSIQYFAWFLIILFLSVLIVVGIWFGHVFKQVSKSPKEIYNALNK